MCSGTPDFSTWSCQSTPPPPTLCRWYGPFKKVLVISQCSVSFQQSAAGSTFHRGTAGSPTHTNTLTATHTHSRSDSQTHARTHACTHAWTQYTQTLTHTPHIHHLQSVHASQRKHAFLAGCLCLRERTDCFEDLSRLSHTQTRGAGADIRGKEEGFTRGHLSCTGNGQLVSMTPCVDSPLLLRQKS